MLFSTIFYFSSRPMHMCLEGRILGFNHGNNSESIGTLCTYNILRDGLLRARTQPMKGRIRRSPAGT